MKKYRHKKSGLIFAKDSNKGSDSWWDEAREINIPSSFIIGSNDYEELDQLLISSDGEPIFSGQTVWFVCLKYNNNKKNLIWKVHLFNKENVKQIKQRANWITRSNNSSFTNFLIFSTEQAGRNYISEKSKKFLFKSIDGVDIYEGDEFWCINVKHDLTSTVYSSKEVQNDLPINYEWVHKFSTKDAAESHLINKTVCLSLDDVKIIILSLTNRKIEYLEALVREKIKLPK